MLSCSRRAGQRLGFLSIFSCTHGAHRINSIVLGNEKYIGDALLQKTITTDFLNKKRVANKGIVPQYYVEGSHEAIIPRELFMQVQEEMARRTNLETGTGRHRTYSGKYALSHHVYIRGRHIIGLKHW